MVSDLTGTDSIPVSGSAGCIDADTTVLQYIGINTSVKGLDDAAFRRCLSLGLNRQSLISGLLSGHAKAAQFPISPVSGLYPAELHTTYSATAFSEALAACESRPTRTLRLLVNEENSFKLSVAREIAASFSAAGIDMTVTALPWADYTAALAAGSFDLYYGEVRLTADWNLAPLLATGGRLNYGGWSDARCDQLLEAARQRTGPEGCAEYPGAAICYFRRQFCRSASKVSLYSMRQIPSPAFPPLPLNRFTNFRTSQFSFGTADVKDSLRDISACFCYAVAEVRHDA